MSWHFFEVAWVTWSCATGWLGFLNDRVPPKLRPIVCEEAVETHVYADLGDAWREVSRLGPAAKPRLWEYRGLRRTELPVTFRPEDRR